MGTNETGPSPAVQVDEQFARGTAQAVFQTLPEGSDFFDNLAGPQQIPFGD